MGDWQKMGHGMRRRMGAPSNTFGAAHATGGIGMDEQSAAMGAASQEGRVAMGPDVASQLIGNLSGNPSHNPDMVRQKYQMQLTDPAMSPTGARKPILNNSTERMGAAFSVKQNYAPMIDPSAGHTQAAGKIVPSSFPRADQAFGAGVGAFS
jgi:hypothetical protein